jgi:hypothetical protein
MRLLDAGLSNSKKRTSAPLEITTRCADQIALRNRLRTPRGSTGFSLWTYPLTLYGERKMVALFSFGGSEAMKTKASIMSVLFLLAFWLVAQHVTARPSTVLTALFTSEIGQAGSPGSAAGSNAGQTSANPASRGGQTGSATANPRQNSTPGSTTPNPGTASPTPGTASPTPGTAAPTPGTASPTPGNTNTPDNPQAPGTPAPGSQPQGQSPNPPTPETTTPPDTSAPNAAPNSTTSPHIL